MAKKTILKTTMTSIADAVREKTGVTGALTPAAMIDAINNIPEGGEVDFSAIATELLQATEILSDAAFSQFMTLANYLTAEQIKPVFTDYDADITVDGSTYDITKLSRLFAVNSADALTAIREYVVINPSQYKVSNHWYVFGESGIANGDKVNITIKNVTVTNTLMGQIYLCGYNVAGKYNTITLDNWAINTNSNKRLNINVAAEKIVLKNFSYKWIGIELGAESSLAEGSIGSFIYDATKVSAINPSYFCVFRDISNFVFTGYTGGVTSFNYFAYSGLPESQCQKLLECDEISGTSSLYFTRAFRNNLNLTTFDFTKIKGGKYNTYESMFEGCANLVNLGTDELTLVCTTAKSMFKNCSSLAIKKVDITVMNYISEMFYGCTSLTEMDLSLNLSKYMYMSDTFKGCTNLRKLTLRYTGTYAYLSISKDSGLFNSISEDLEEFTLVVPETISTFSVGYSVNVAHPFVFMKKMDLSGVASANFTMPINMLTAYKYSTYTGYYLFQTILFPSKVIYNMGDSAITIYGLNLTEGVASNFVKTYGGQSSETLYTLTLYIPQAEYDKLTADEISNFENNGGVLEVVA